MIERVYAVIAPLAGRVSQFASVASGLVLFKTVLFKTVQGPGGANKELLIRCHWRCINRLFKSIDCEDIKGWLSSDYHRRSVAAAVVKSWDFVTIYKDALFGGCRFVLAIWLFILW